MAKRQISSRFMFLRACEQGEIDTVRELIDSKDVDPNWVSETGRGLISSGHLVKGLAPLHLSCG